ncbi:MAG: helix-turn-helix domain-containing protein, partial [Candidatus Nealsonbacteria bacterium]|nr:helix-turn-helix domain-containing protein [Candidatus Nealsonbacteria bacterium]
MAKTLKREKALELRKKGKSIKEISRALNVAKSTVSAWCRDIILGRKQIEGLIKKQRSGSYRGRMIIAEKFRRIRIEEEKLLRIRGLREIGKLTKRELFITGIGMYWSEGETY